MAIRQPNIHSLDDFNLWLDKCREFAANNWDLMDDCEVILTHEPVLVGTDNVWDAWKEGPRSISIHLKTKAPK